MALPDLTEEERGELVRLIRDAIDGDRYFMSPRVKLRKAILAKLDPASVNRTPPHPAPKPPGEPSLLYRKLKGGRRR